MNSRATFWSRVAMLFVLFGCMVFASNSRAQQDRVANYTVTQFGGGTINMSGLPAYFPNTDDGTLSFGIPFDFWYDDAKITAGSTVYVNTNWGISFNNAIPPVNQYLNVLGNSSYPNMVMPFHCDAYVHGGIRLGVANAAPNRILIVEFDSVRRWSDPVPSDAKYTRMQVWFFENPSPLGNVIEFRYRDFGFDWLVNGTHEAVGDVGLNGKSTPSFSHLKYQVGSQYSPNSNVRFTPKPKPDQRLALSPESIDFGLLLAGEISPEFDVTVKNVGATTNLVVSAATLTGSDFTLVSAPPSNTYLPGQSGVYKLRFSPLGSGARTGSFTVTSNGLDSGQQSVSLVGFGIAPQVEYVVENTIFRKTRTRLGDSLSHSFIIKSTGNGPLTLKSAIVTGEYGHMYKVTRKPTLIPAGTHDTLTVTYYPSEEGLRTATLEMRTNALVNSDKSVVMYGTGILPRLMITPTMVRLDSVGMGDTAYATVRLSNVGSDTLAILSNYLSHADRDFTYMGLIGSDSLIGPERFRDVQIRFIPQTRGHRQARLRVMTNIPMTYEEVRRDTSEFSIDIVGTAVPYGLLSLEGQSTLDSALIGTEVCSMVRIWNNGESPLVINSSTISGTDAGDFTINGVTYPFTIAPEGYRDVELCARPSLRGLRSALIEVSATSGDKTSTTQLPLAVFGLAACSEPDGPTAFLGQITKIGLKDTAIVTITNCGDVPMSFTAIVSSSNYALISIPASGEILPGGTFEYSIQFTPSVMDLQQGSLIVSADHIDDIEVDLMGIGGKVVLEAVNATAPNTMVSATSNQFNVEVRNAGNIDFEVGTPNVSGTEFTLVTPPASIAAGATENFVFTFTPSAVGNRTATMSFTESGVGTIQINGLGVTSSVRKVADRGYELMQNYPNPVSGASKIDFIMAEAGYARIVVSDVSGNVVAVVGGGFFGAGLNDVRFDGTRLPSGSYFYELEANGVRLQRSMVLNK